MREVLLSWKPRRVLFPNVCSDKDLLQIIEQIAEVTSQRQGLIYTIDFIAWCRENI